MARGLRPQSLTFREDAERLHGPLVRPAGAAGLPTRGVATLLPLPWPTATPAKGRVCIQGKGSTANPLDSLARGLPCKPIFNPTCARRPSDRFFVPWEKGGLGLIILPHGLGAQFPRPLLPRHGLAGRAGPACRIISVLIGPPNAGSVKKIAHNVPTCCDE